MTPAEIIQKLCDQAGWKSMNVEWVMGENILMVSIKPEAPAAVPAVIPEPVKTDREAVGA